MSVLELFETNINGGQSEIDTEYLPSISITNPSVIKCDDGSINITNGDNGIITLSNAGEIWAHYNATESVNMEGNSIFSCGYVEFDSFGGPTDANRRIYFGTPSNVGINGGPLLMSDGVSIGQIYDSHFNKPPIINNYNNTNITNVSSLKVNGYLEIGNAASNTAQLHMFYTDGTENTNNFQLISSSSGCQLQFYQGTKTMSTSFVCGTDNSMTLCDSKNASPKVYINGVSGPSQIYDTIYNIPPTPTISNNQIENRQIIQINILSNPRVQQNPTWVVNNNNLVGEPVQIAGLTSLPVTTSFAQCTYFRLLINQFLVNLGSVGNCQPMFFLTEKSDFTTITQDDFNKNTHYATSIAFTTMINLTSVTGDNYSYNNGYGDTLFIEYCATSPPTSLFLCACVRNDGTEQNTNWLGYSMLGELRGTSVNVSLNPTFSPIP
jgi:hypothetical protein